MNAQPVKQNPHELIAAARRFVVEDLFVVVRAGRPGVSCIKRQLYARENHSYFLVFVAR